MRPECLEMAYQLWALVHGMTVLEGIDLTMVSGDLSYPDASLRHSLRV